MKRVFQHPLAITPTTARQGSIGANAGYVNYTPLHPPRDAKKAARQRVA